jgi:Flp pilus assembly protein TadG
MVAIGILVSAAMIGSAIDMSLAYRVKNRLQTACDAATLAGRKAVVAGGFDTTAQAAASSYFNLNFNANALSARDVSFRSVAQDHGNTIIGTATATVNTVVMNAFGFNQFSLSVECTATMGVGNSDVMMVLDTTGSMLDTASGSTPAAGESNKLQNLQTAMKSFFDTVAEATRDSNARIRYGFVPYSSSVNVGRLIRARNNDYLVDAHPVQSRQWYVWEDTPETSTGSQTSSVYYDSSWTRLPTAYNSETSCLGVEPADTGWANNGSPDTSGDVSTYINASGQKVVQTTVSSQQQRMTLYECRYRSRDGKWYVNQIGAYRNLDETELEISDPVFLTGTGITHAEGAMYRQVQYDVSDYKNFDAVPVLVGDDGYGNPASVTSTWAGCIEERATLSDSTFSWVPGSGIAPGGALDLNIDMAPTSDDATKWAPMWPELAYYRTTGSSLALSGTKANSYCPQQARLMAEMDEGEFDTYANSLIARGSTYHDLGILWGARLSSPAGIWADNVNDEPGNGGAVSRHLIFMTDGELAPSSSIQSSYGIERNDWRITDNGSSNLTSRHRSRFLALCEAVKGKGIRLWVIAFGTSLTADLQTCASSSSSYAARDASQLNAAFQEIASSVGELRVTS